MDPDPSSSIIVLAISLLASAFFSGMEMAFVASSRLQTELNAQSSIRGKIVAALSNRPQLFIASMLALFIISASWFMLAKQISASVDFVDPPAAPAESERSQLVYS